MHGILDEIDFAKKVKICWSHGMISDSLKRKLFAVNNVRVNFSHMVTQKNRIEIQKTVKMRTYLEKLEKLYNAMRAMNEEMKKKLPTWYSNPVDVIEKNLGNLNSLTREKLFER